MDWSKAKTLLMLTFLILNVYLAIQLMDRMVEPRIVATSATGKSILKDRHIDEKKLQPVTRDIGYLTAEVDARTLAPLASSPIRDAVASVKNDVEWSVRLTKPYRLETKTMRDSASSFVQASVRYGAEYTFWKYDSKYQEMTFVQTYKGQPLYSTPQQSREDDAMIGPSLLVLQLNDAKEIVSYKQRHLNKVVRQAQDVTLLSASEAIVQLSEQGLFPVSKRLTSHKLGYFCLVTEGTESVQILPPTWQIELDNEEVYFVNAIDGGVQTVERLDTVSEK
ncbi:two-component system regulatory protein YycI [Exiguobacterium sp.]|uniref:two-component system regulatory protein YycI n=1 Tax=Exiguobacterium sp. TaxID=44751 RepID=UPI0028B099E8|nr:two-component system regulatory protein YycI [Exiguobacterium sp.]